MKEWSVRCHVTDFEDRAKDPGTKEYGQLLENRKVQETNSPPEPPERNAVLLTP